ncbi:MAG: hypothetical protein KDC87_10895 [Planctomycetes bacterium]|nr:hypothetical protein [Planctomycetota bacterium]MCB9889406.1 hypothetical protein [Planctomycetota bacterium]
MRELITRDAGLLEHGLEILSEDLVLGQDNVVDVLARDAAGAPVLLFTAAPERVARLRTDLCGAHSWMGDNAEFLVRELGDSVLRADLPPRCIVVGIEFLTETLRDLQGLGGGLDVRVVQVCWMHVGGRLRVGMTDLPSSAPGVSAPGGRTMDRPAALRRTDGWQIPPGVVAPGDRKVLALFLDLLQRVDHRLGATADRFSLHVSCAGTPIVVAGLVDGRLQAQFSVDSDGGEPVRMELDATSCHTVVDRVMRHVLARFESSTYDCRTLREVASDRPANERSDPRAVTIGLQGTGQTRRGSVDRFSLEPIRRMAAEAQLSRAEISALGEDCSDA